MFKLKPSFWSLIRLKHPLSQFVFPFSTEFSKIRNIGISAHIDSGKTTFSERVLFYAGKIGSIHQVKGSDNVGATMDFMELQKEKGITIQSAATHLRWNDYDINLIDTPGHIDFTIEVERALRVLDGGVLLICGVAGVQPQTLTVNKQMMRYKVPRIMFINKLDRLGANPFTAIDSVRKKLGLICAAVQIPIGENERFRGLVDIIERKAYFFDGASGEKIREEPVPENLVNLMQAKRLQLIEQLSNVDPELEEMYLEEKQPSIQMLYEKIRKLTIQRKFIPVYMGSAYKNKGVQLALDGVLKYLPSPRDKQNRGFEIGKNEANKKTEKQIVLQINEKKPFVGYVFKMQESRFGQLSYVRVYQGKVKKGDYVWCDKLGKKLKIARMAKMHANQMQDISEVKAGDIFAIFGGDCPTGQTLTEGDMNYIVKCQSMFVPQPVMSYTIKAANKDGTAKMHKALTKFQRQDPTFRMSVDKESEEIIISGMGQLHLQIYVERINRDFGVQTIIGHPAVNYRETIAERANFDYLHKKQTGGAGQYARVIGYIEPIKPEKEEEGKEVEEGEEEEEQKEEQNPKCEFVSKITGTVIPPEFITAVEKTFYDIVNKGPQTGYPVIGVRYVLESGATHVVDSSSTAFAVATRYSFTKAMENAQPQVLEPLMEVEVNCSKDVYSSVMAGLMKRKGSITDTITQGEMYTLRADVPLRQMFGYAMQLRSLTSGEGDYSMEYKKHTPMSPGDAKVAIQKYKKKKKEKQ